MNHNAWRIHVSALGLSLLLTAGSSCGPARPNAEGPGAEEARTAVPQVGAARELTALYARSRLASWKLTATATGPRCTVLRVEIPQIMDASMIEALHFGTGSYDVYHGGIQTFYPQHQFTGVIYEDAAHYTKSYGEVGDGWGVPCGSPDEP